jgi:hypothetical protein
MRSDNDVPRDGVVVEWAPFRLAAGIDDSTLLEASEAIQRDFLEHQPGFLRRELLRGADGGWVDLVFWQDEHSAAAAMSSAGSSPVCYTYFHLMEGGDSMDAGAGVLHLHRVRVYDAAGVD